MGHEDDYGLYGVHIITADDVLAQVRAGHFVGHHEEQATPITWRKLEPSATKLEVFRRLQAEGIPTGIAKALAARHVEGLDRAELTVEPPQTRHDTRGPGGAFVRLWSGQRPVMAKKVSIGRHWPTKDTAA